MGTLDLEPMLKAGGCASAQVDWGVRNDQPVDGPPLDEHLDR